MLALIGRLVEKARYSVLALILGALLVLISCVQIKDITKLDVQPLPSPIYFDLKNPVVQRRLGGQPGPGEAGNSPTLV